MNWGWNAWGASRMRRIRRKLSSEWESELREVRASVYPPEPEWVVQWAKPEDFGFVPPVQRKECVRVTFPLRFGYGCGTGGAEAHGLVLRLGQVKGGADISAFEESRQRPWELRRKVDQRLVKAAGVADAAGVLLLGQALCGPAAACAMFCLAAVGLVRFAGIQIQQRVRSWSGEQVEVCPRGWTVRADEFSAAGAVLSIAIPLLKWQMPELHRTLKCIGAAIPLSAGYARTAFEVKNAPVGGSGAGDVKWRLRHRWAARRLCRLLSDLREPPALGWVCDAADAASLVAVRGTWVATKAVVALGSASDHSWFTFSYPLPIVLSSRQSEKLVEEKQIIVTVEPQASSVSGGWDANEEVSAEFEKFHYLAQLEEPGHFSQVEGFGGRAGVRSDAYMLELGVTPTGWRGFQQKASLFVRACWLALVFLPLIIFGPLLYFISTIIVSVWGAQLRMLIWLMLRFCLERGGAAFIKWGQWSATREDLFPNELCAVLGRLHDRAPEHSFRETRRAVKQYLGRSIEEIFEEFPQKPCASGSIAQVYRAKLKNCGDGTPADVAVKVRHPSVGVRIYQDFQIMSLLADVIQKLPALRWLNLRQSVEQFSHTLTAQADLRIEAENLELFNKNFDLLQSSVAWPKLVPNLVSEGVIVETFERGQAMHKCLRQRSPLNTQIAAIGVDAYLKMMLVDNFVHTDLHPGNMLVRAVETEWDKEVQERLQLVLLDCGLAEKLPPRVRYHFLSFIMMIGAGNGERAAHHLLKFSWPYEQRCKHPELVIQDMKQLFAAECDIQERPIDLNDVLKKVLKLCRKHEVTVDSSYATLLVAACVLVAFAHSLDPDMCIMDATVPCLFLYNLTGRVMGRIYG